MSKKIHLIRDVIIVGISIGAAILLTRASLVESLLGSTYGLKLWVSFLAGILFTSGFTIAPATVILAKLAENNSIFGVAVLGGMGAVIFVNRKISWLTITLGAAVLVSPLPDELGLVMMGVSKIKTKMLIPMIFLLKFLGIFLVGLIAQGLITFW